MGLTCS